ncbi:MAG: hypothetical protein H6918_10505 [Sphingomonadaceae bacterium]|nr:hypothetical protein [Sphingomonadaceae bacterium]
MDDKREYDRLRGLLPAYVNGTIDEEERLELEQALSQSSVLREELGRERDLARMVRNEMEAQVAEAEEHREERLATLSDRLPEQEPARLLGDAGSAPTPKRNPLSFLNPARWRPAIALSVALAGLGGFSVKQAQDIARLEAENFRLASGQCEDAAQGVVVIEVADTAGWGELVALLEQEGLSIASSGAFGALVLSGGKEGESAAELAERLRSYLIIASAKPAA